MKLEERVEAFVKLGKLLTEKASDWQNDTGVFDDKFQSAMGLSKVNNPWFDKQSMVLSLQEWSKQLTMDCLQDWLNLYADRINNLKTPKIIGVVAAGNIPMVSFHDFISVLLTGHQFKGKMAKSDEVVLPYLTSLLIEIEPRFKELISFSEDRLEGFDAVIATGSDNSARYFDYYFGKYPNVIRKNRNAIAVLDGTETVEEMKGLGNDIFQYYGLGCRNVSKILIPTDYKIDQFYEGIFPFSDIVNHNKYGNNYDYNRTLYLMSQVEFFDNGFLLVKEDEKLSSPIATMYFERYGNDEELNTILERHGDDIQCIVSKKLSGNNIFKFGEAQQPKLNDYADGVDTIEFLCELSA